MPAGSKVWTTRQHALDLGQRHAEALGELEQRAEEIAGLVDPLDDLVGDDEVGAGQHLAGLAAQMIVERDVVAREAVEIRPVARAAAAAVPSRPRPPSRPRMESAALSWWKILVVEIDVERRVAAVAVGLAHQFVDRRRPRVSAHRLGASAVAAPARPRRAGFQQRILLHLLGDEGLDLEVGQRQQLDRLLELRRHHQRLGLTEIEAGPSAMAYAHCVRAVSCRSSPRLRDAGWASTGSARTESVDQRHR